MRKYSLLPDQSIIEDDGKIVFFSGARFQREIVEGHACFLCGRKRSSVSFNDEHVIPDWILRRAELHDKFIVLPNGATQRYAEYKIPCCVSCNGFLGQDIEIPVSTAFKAGISGVITLLKKKGPWPLFQWMTLLYLKTHLKDRLLRYHLDRRRGAEPISVIHDWGVLHHVHCVARSSFTHALVDKEVLGSLMVFQTREEGFEPFDYADLPSGAIMVRLGNIGIVAVVNDACAAYNLESKALLPIISGALTPLQLREILSRVAYVNQRLRTRPTHFSYFREDRYALGARSPKKISLKRIYPGGRGRIMHALAKDFVARLPENERPLIEANLKSGKWSFLFKSDGTFNDKCDV